MKITIPQSALRLFYLQLLVLFFTACGPSTAQKKKAIATQIGQETCNEISNLSSGIMGGMLSALISQVTDGNISGINTGNIGKLPDSWCDCYTHFVVKDLTEKFTYQELVEIKKDKAKQVLVLKKIVEMHQQDLKQCITDSTGNIFKSYNDFSKDLDKKFSQ